MDYSDITIYNLPPQSTPFVGRRSEILDIVTRIRDEDCRLLTLVGSGGTGKTRLAIESIPAIIESDFVHGVFYVPLTPLISADTIVTTIINVLGIIISEDGTPHEELVKFLSQRNLLLVMDNFEHLLEGVDIVADILNTATHVKILVTSREPLNLSMEHVWHVHGMRYPTSEDPDAINQYDALNLFVERAMQSRRDFSPSDEQIAIIQICQLVDGLPLAIELAAGWLKSLSSQDIIKQIKHGIDFLATRNRDVPQRHRSIRAVFDHSWNLLTTAERAVFPKLSVFRGGFTLDATQHIAGASLVILSGLVEKSMVRRNSDGRYDLHELLRQYGEEQLINFNTLDQINESHLNYFADFMEQRIPDLQGRRQADSLNEIRADFDNILAAWQYASERSNYTKLDTMLESISIYSNILGYPPLVNEMYAFASNHLDESPIPKHILIRNRLKVFAFYASFNQNSERNSEQLIDGIRPCLKIAEQYDDKLSLWICLIITMFDPLNPNFQSDIQRQLEVAENLSPFYLARALYHNCQYYSTIRNEDNEVTSQYLKRCLDITQAMGDINGRSKAYFHLAHYARFWGSIDDAIYYFTKAIQDAREIIGGRNIAFYEAHRVLMRLKKGEFAYFLEQTPLWAEEMARFGYFANHPYMYTMMAKAEALLGNYEQSKTHLQTARSYPSHKFYRLELHMLEAKIICAIGEDDFQSAHLWIIEALQINASMISIRLKLDFLTLIVFLYHHDHHSIIAVELLGLIFTHSLATTGWMEKWELLSRLRETLQHDLGKYAYQSAWEQGAKLSLNETITKIHAYVGLEPSPNRSSQSLIEPLTNRELDVLQLLGKGQTNRAIAQELTVTIGTVKTHVYNICQKFAVKNRVQAVLEAKKLGLL